MAFTANSTLTSASQQGPVTRAIQAMRTEPEPPRRGFLRGLLSLPLIGGGVALIGAPTAVAEPVTLGVVERYCDWLATEYGEALIERSVLRDPKHAEWIGEWRRDWCRKNGTLCGIEGQHRFLVPPAELPSSRAALVLSTVGADWRR